MCAGARHKSKPSSRPLPPPPTQTEGSSMRAGKHPTSHATARCVAPRDAHCTAPRKPNHTLATISFSCCCWRNCCITPWFLAISAPRVMSGQNDTQPASSPHRGPKSTRPTLLNLLEKLHLLLQLALQRRKAIHSSQCAATRPRTGRPRDVADRVALRQSPAISGCFTTLSQKRSFAP